MKKEKAVESTSAKEEKKNSVRSTKEEPKKKDVVKKSDQKKDKKSSKKAEKKSIFQRIAGFFVGVKKEIVRVRWLSKKEMVKYSLATIVFVAFFALFFYLIDIIFALIRSLV